MSPSAEARLAALKMFKVFQRESIYCFGEEESFGCTGFRAVKLHMVRLHPDTDTKDKLL